MPVTRNRRTDAKPSNPNDSMGVHTAGNEGRPSRSAGTMRLRSSMAGHSNAPVDVIDIDALPDPNPAPNDRRVPVQYAALNQPGREPVQGNQTGLPAVPIGTFAPRSTRSMGATSRSATTSGASSGSSHGNHARFDDGKVRSHRVTSINTRRSRFLLTVFAWMYTDHKD